MLISGELTPLRETNPKVAALYRRVSRPAIRGNYL